MSEFKKNAYKIFIQNTDYEAYDIYQTQLLHKGYTNISYFFETVDKKQYQVRIANDGGIVNRKNEFNVLKTIKDQKYLFYDLKTGNAIKKWIPGINPDIKTINSTWFLKKISQKIKAFHKIKFSEKDILKHDYFEFIKDAKLNKIHHQAYFKLISKYQDLPMVLSHNDLNKDNVLIYDHDVVFIDFEWSCLNNEYWDYANFVRECDFDQKIIRRFIKLNHHLDKKTFYDFIYLATSYAYQWSFYMPQTKKMIDYQAKTLKQLEKYYKWYIAL